MSVFWNAAAESMNNYDIEPAEKQNWYPDFTFISRHNSGIKFALDLRNIFCEIESIPAVIGDFTFFAAEKWRIASGKSGSGNTANMGSIQFIDDIINGNGVFAKAGEELFNDYWANFGRIKIQGIKTKLIPVIRQNVSLKKNILWIEPFMGSGVVGFNTRPERAIFADINPHIILIS